MDHHHFLCADQLITTTQAITTISSHLAEFLSDEQSLHHAVSSLLHSPTWTNNPERSTHAILLTLADPSTPFSLVFVACLTLLLNGFQDPAYFRTLRTRNIPASNYLQSDQPSQLIPILLAIGARIGLVPSSLFSPTSNQSHSDQRYAHTLSKPQPDPLDPTTESYSERKLKPLIAGLLYELCRVQKLEDDIIDLFSEQLVDNLFELVESTRDQEDETLNYNLIKLIIALNEQFMIAGLTRPSQTTSHRFKTQHNSSESDDNIIIRTMKHRLNESKTFGENLIFILNRASHSTPEGLCVSLLILKILYLLFTTPGTHEYFYKNDLCVLVDIFIRELSNLPDEHNDLRHTYLRVLHPLLTQTQLRTYAYKREEIRQVLLSHIKYAHLQDLNPTTQRLIQRNLQSEWCLELTKKSEPSRQKPDLPRSRPKLKRFPSQDTLESQLSGGSSIAEVTSSNTENKITNARIGSPASLLNFHHQDFSSSSDTTKPPPVVVAPNNLQSSVVAQDKNEAFVQVIIADADPGPSSEVMPNLPTSASSTSLSEPIHLPSSFLSSSHVRPVSPISEGSPRPSSSGSLSHSPARRPAPKPPICKRSGQMISSPLNLQAPPPLPHQKISDTLRYSFASSSSSSLVDEDVTISSEPTVVRRKAPTPHHHHPEDRTIKSSSHRRKAPAPPPHHLPNTLRGTKSIGHFPSNPLLHHPSSFPPHPSSSRIVSLHHHPLPPSDHDDLQPSSKTLLDSNPFAD